MFELLMHPVVLCASGLAWLLLRKPRAAAQPAPAAGPGELLVTLDMGAPPPVRDKVLSEIVYGRDPSALDGSAAELASLGYPLCARELRARAATLRARQPAPVSPCAAIDPSLDSATCQSVLNALQTSKTPEDLLTFAASIQAKYPQAAAVLSAQASALQAAQAPAATAPAAAPTAPSSAAPAGDAGAAVQTVAEGALGQIAADVAMAAGRVAPFQGAPDPTSRAAHQVPEQEQTGAGAQSAALAPLARPPGGHYVKIRSSDKVHPDNLAKMGSGGNRNAHLSLYARNPHLVGADGTVSSFATGAEVAIPDDWAGRLRERGFEVRRDLTSGSPSSSSLPAGEAPPA